MSQVSQLRTTADTIIASHDPGSNYGGDEHVYMGRFSDGTYSEVYENFDIYSQVPAVARVSAATLQLKQYDDPNDWQSPTISCAAVLAGGSWTEGGLTKNNAPGTASGSPAALHSVHNEDTWHTWDVTALMQKVFAGNIQWNGFRLYYTGSSDSNMKYFRSKEYAAADGALLTITWDYPFPEIQVGGAWHQISDSWIQVGGTWRQVTEMQINAGGTWKTPTG